ncbi:MAG TPA: DUF1990 family protein [Mycobacteriales bacterium]|nr:DUF1990 family protein [Mycobacteriales bacterium]
MQIRLIGDPGARLELADMHELPVNYTLASPDEATVANGWTVDTYSCVLATEPPGEPVPGGAYDVACRLTRDYEFADPSIIKAVWLPERPLESRDMLFEARFLFLRFFIGVRISDVVDTTRPASDGRGVERAWGYCYRTLQGHFEMGEMCYEVVKSLETGRVEFRIRRYVRTGTIPNLVLKLGWNAFGRMMQTRFVRRSMGRMQRLVAAELAPGRTAATVPLAAESIEVRHAADDPAAAERIDG